MDLRTGASAVSYLVVGAFYLYLGARLARRDVGGDGGHAARLFGVWWLGLGTHSSIAGVVAIAAGTGVWSPLGIATATYLAAIIIAAMSYGLSYYMLYLLTGRVRVVRLLKWVYLPLVAAMLAAVAYAQPQAVHMAGWLPIIDYARPEGSALDGIASLVFIFPPFLASGAYATLWWRVREPGKRWRIALTGGALFTWMVTSVLVGSFSTDAAAITARAVALAAAIAAHLAYAPPRWAQRRYGARRLDEEVVAPPVDAFERAARQQALAARARELV